MNMKSMSIVVAVGLIALAVFGSAYVASRGEVASPESNMPTITLVGQTVRVTLADTEEKRAQGLSGRSGLAPDEGMLFIFQADGRYSFWMKDMQFSIDILWLDAEGQVVYMAQNVSPDTYPRGYRSDRDARYVLELPSGWAERYNVRVGDTAVL